jgi:hypothetical protein
MILKSLIEIEKCKKINNLISFILTHFLKKEEHAGKKRLREAALPSTFPPIL